MSGSVLWRFVQKDLYFATPLMVGAVLCGIVALPLVRLGAAGAYLAMVLMICGGAAPAVFLCMYSVLGERKERSALFALSLPISTFEHSLAKVIAASIGFFLPWAVLALGALIAFQVLPLPAGVLPLGALFWVFALDQFALMLVVTMMTDSEAATVSAIVVFNVSIGFYIFVVSRIPAVAAHVGGPVAVWSPVVFQILAVQAVIAVLAIGLLLAALARKKDFV